MYVGVTVSCIALITRKVHIICVVGKMNQVLTNKSLSEKPTLGQGRDNVLSSSDTDFYDWELTANSCLHFLLRALWNLECVNSLSHSLASSWKQHQELSAFTYLTGNLRLDEIRCSNTLSYHKDRCSCRQVIMSPGIVRHHKKKLFLSFDHTGILILLNYYSSFCLP